MSNSNMTPQQAAEVLRNFNEGISLPILHAALETAIECMSAKDYIPENEIESAAIHNSGTCSHDWHDHDCSCPAFEDGAKWAIARLSTAHPDTPTPTDEFELKPCEKCYQLTNHIGDVCQKCKPKSNTPTELTVEKLDEISDKYIYIGADDKPYLSLAGAHEIIKAYFPTPTDYCPCTPDETTGEMSANEGKTWQCNICGKTVNPSDHTRLNTPTDEQIGKLFDQHTDVSVLLNPISPTHAMTRTAAIQFAKALFGQFKSES